MNPGRPSGGVRARATGFTLIELLVVIGLIALLLSFLLPALSGSKRMAQTAACKTRLREIGWALSLYASDSGVYPVTLDRLSQYLDQRQASRKPADTNRVSAPLSFPLYQCPAKLAYSLNLYGAVAWPENQRMLSSTQSLGLSVTWPADPPYGPGLPEAAVLVPSDMFASGDAVVETWAGGPAQPYFVQGPHFRPAYLHRPSREYPDLGFANMLFCDGHVSDGRRTKWEAPTDLARRRWNRDHEAHHEHFMD